jgi:hypothetical protein
MPKIYLEAKNGAHIELDLTNFLKKNTTFAYGKASKEEARITLEKAFSDIYNNIEDVGSTLHMVILETKPAEVKDFNYKRDYMGIDLLQQFFLFYVVELGDVLCRSLINNSYIMQSGNTGYLDIAFYGVLKGNNSIIVKSFIYIACPSPDVFYVNVTCGTGGTALLFDKLKLMVQDKSFNEPTNNKVKYIALDSIENDSTINFYSKIGFYKNNKDTNRIAKDMIDTIYKGQIDTFEDYVKKTKKVIGGDLIWSPYSKVLQKEKCSYVYEPGLWFVKILEAKEQGIAKKDALNKFYLMHQDLKGAGFFERPT